LEIIAHLTNSCRLNTASRLRPHIHYRSSSSNALKLALATIEMIRSVKNPPAADWTPVRHALVLASSVLDWLFSQELLGGDGQAMNARSFPRAQPINNGWIARTSWGLPSQRSRLGPFSPAFARMGRMRGVAPESLDRFQANDHRASQRARTEGRLDLCKPTNLHRRSTFLAMRLARSRYVSSGRNRARF